MIDAMPTTDWRSRRRGTGKRYVKVGADDSYEHRAIAETALGKPLPQKAEVHHVDGNKKNNSHANLVICQDTAYHRLLHVRARVKALGGNPNTEAWCGACTSLRPLGEFYVRRTTSGHQKAGRRVSHCKACQRESVALWRLRRLSQGALRCL